MDSRTLSFACLVSVLANVSFGSAGVIGGLGGGSSSRGGQQRWQHYCYRSDLR